MFYSYLEFLTLDIVHKTSGSECYKPLSERLMSEEVTSLQQEMISWPESYRILLDGSCTQFRRHTQFYKAHSYTSRPKLSGSYVKRPQCDLLNGKR
jgi:hypothetical protein